MEPMTTEKLTVYFVTNDWSGLHDAFEKEDWGLVAGVPLVPLYWKRLAEKGHNIHIFVTGNFSCDKDFVLEGIHFHRVRIPGYLAGAVKGRTIRTYLKVFWLLHTLKCIKKMKKEALISPPDAVYSYGTGSNVAAWRISRKFRIPFLVHYWGTWLGHHLLKEPWYKRFRVLPQILMFKLPIDLLIISNDGTEGDRVVDKVGFPKERFRFWLDGTAPDLYKPDLDKVSIKKSIGLLPEDKMIFQAARLDFWKRIDRTIAAMPNVIKEVPSAKLVVAGDGHLRKDLEEQAQTLGVADHVKFLGFVPHSRVLELHNAADLFITVQDLTNLGNQIIEALHSRTCTIAYDIGGTRHVMQDGITGRLLNETQLQNLSGVMIDLLKDDGAREKMAEGAFQFARKNIWTWDQRIEAELDDLKRLVKNKQEQRGL